MTKNIPESDGHVSQGGGTDDCVLHDRRALLKSSVGIAALLAATGGGGALAQTSDQQSAPETGSKSKRPNILVIWGDDIGWANVSAYGLGVMGYRTPNIDRIGKEGVIFTEHYGQPSCTAGRAAFITGQYPIRSGNTTVGQPGDKLGLQVESPSLAEIMKDMGYATGHFGKSHLGDRNEHLPTNHGFDEFFGNLYHLNVSEEDQQRDYQHWAAKYPGGKESYEKKYLARGVIHSVATDKVVDKTDPRFGPYLKQEITDTGPLHTERMKTIDEEEIGPRAMKFMKDAKDANKPFFVWLNTTRGHLYVHLDDKWRYAAEDFTSEADLAGSGVMKHDWTVGLILDFLDKNGLTENTIVWYSTDNGPEHSSWPDGQTTPFRSEKMSTYEGGVRMVSLLRWPGVIKPGQIMGGIQCHQDMFTSLAVAAGATDPNGWYMEKKKQYIDGVDNTSYWMGGTKSSARDSIFYYYEDKLTAVRVGNWKWHFSTKDGYYGNVVPLTVPKVYNIHADPYESYDEWGGSAGHLLQKVSWQIAPIKELLGAHLETLVKYPPVQVSKSFAMGNLVHDFLNKGHE
jgi:arylsulfatase